MVDHEQVRPLAPAADRPSSDDEEVGLHRKKIRRRRCLKCCGCCSALLLIIAIVIVILIFTVFRMKDPVIRLNSLTVTRLELINGTIPKPGVNMSYIADVSVKNPNAASFKYGNTTTQLYYRGMLAGEARGPPGYSKAHRTMRLNVSVDIITDKIMSSPTISADLASRLLNLTTFTRVPGRVKMLAIIRFHVVAKMNCSVAVNMTTQTIQNMKCKQKIHL